MKKYRCGLLFGSFDPLHYGHIRLIRKARELCCAVYVCIDSDDLIRDTKHREPMSGEIARAKDMRDIKGVLQVGVKSEKANKKFWIRHFRPDVLIKGSDWIGKDWGGEGLGVEVKYVPYTKGISSTMFHEAKI